MDKHKIMALLHEPMDGLKISYTAYDTSAKTGALNGSTDYISNGTTNALYVGDPVGTGGTLKAWDFWQNDYYPKVIRESYPVYIQERAMDKGQKAFEILKSLQDKKIVKFDKVSDFIDAMDTLIKII